MPPASLLPCQKIVQGQQVRNFSVLRSDTAVNLISIHLHKQRDYDVTKFRIAVYKQNWKNTSEHSVPCQFENWSEEGIDVLSNEI